jgi:hypothetical protein
MNRKLFSSILLALLLISMLGTVFKSKEAITYAEDTILRIAPSNTTIGQEGQPIVNQQTTFTIEVENVTNLHSWQIVLYYNSSILRTQVDWMWLPLNHVFNGKTFNVTSPSMGADDYGSYIVFWASLFSEEPAFNGTGILCEVNFTATASGNSYLKFSKYIGTIQGSAETFLRTSGQESIPALAVEGAVEVKGELSLKDIALVGVATSKSIVGKSYNIYVSATVENQGNHAETFGLIFYANTSIIETKNVTLASGFATQIMFVWNTTKFSRGKYIIGMYALPIVDESDIADNNCTGGWVTITIPGDVSGDFEVEGKDIAISARFFGSFSGNSRWDSNADVDGDRKVDGRDIAIVARNYGKSVWGQAATVTMDKPIYSPTVEVFWNRNASVPIKVKVKDNNIYASYAKVRVSSSIENREVDLPKIGAGIYEDVINVTDLAANASAYPNNSLHAKYGDIITVGYFDTFCDCNVTVEALFLFPRYVDDFFFNDLKAWKLFDEEGVPLADYGGKIGAQYNPVTISQYALALYHAFLGTGNVTLRAKFLIQANWLVAHAKDLGNFTVWQYKFDWAIYNMTDPWVSAMAQGEGVSVLTRAYTLTGNRTFLEAAEKAIGSFEVEKDDGGVRFTDYDGVWFEEYADSGDLDSKVLNGFVFALYGLYEYAFETNCSESYGLFWTGTNTLEANVQRYDVGYWSYYDLLGHFAGGTYHEIHIEQLGTMYLLTGIEKFQFYSDKFRSYVH